MSPCLHPMTASLLAGSPVVPQNVTKSTEQARPQPGNYLLCSICAFERMSTDSKLIVWSDNMFFLYIKCFDKAIFFFLSFFPILSWCWHLRQSSIITLCSQQNLDTLAVIVMSTLHVCSLDIVVEFELWNCFQLLFVTNKNLESKHHITSSITWLNTGSYLSQPTLSSVREDRAEWRNKLQEERN